MYPIIWKCGNTTNTSGNSMAQPVMVDLGAVKTPRPKSMALSGKCVYYPQIHWLIINLSPLKLPLGCIQWYTLFSDTPAWQCSCLSLCWASISTIHETVVCGRRALTSQKCHNFIWIGLHWCWASIINSAGCSMKLLMAFRRGAMCLFVLFGVFSFLGVWELLSLILQLLLDAFSWWQNWK